MDPLKIKEILNNFKEGNIDVLVCTTIIESGIDIPTQIPYSERCR